jgi:hypothetical protein
MADEQELIPAVAEAIPYVEGLPTEVAARCHAIITGLYAATRDGLRQVHDETAPYGKFKAWCDAYGLNYVNVLRQLNYVPGRRKQATGGENSSAPLLEAPPEQHAETREERWARWERELVAAIPELAAEEFAHVRVWHREALEFQEESATKIRKLLDQIRAGLAPYGGEVRYALWLTAHHVPYALRPDGVVVPNVIAYLNAGGVPTL